MNNHHRKTIANSISICPIFPAQAADQITKMLGEISQANSIIANISITAQNNAIKGGFAAETFHGESFNLDAILKNKDIRAFTDGFANTPLTRNNTLHDIVVMKDGK